MNRTITAAALAATAFTAGAQVTSTFDTDADGWSTINDTSSFGFDALVGNPAGSIVGVDRASGAIWYFAAPSKFLGNQSAALGGTLSWDILGLTGSQSLGGTNADVFLSSGGTLIGIDLGFNPNTTDFTNYSVDLSFDAGWEFVSSTNGNTNGNAVDAATFASVLANLDGLFIRGEYTTGSDSSALDNVVLTPAPAGAMAFAGVGLLAARRRR
ncbi:MAG: laminin B domain-containing protein [Planctomycetota bacterium]